MSDLMTSIREGLDLFFVPDSEFEIRILKTPKNEARGPWLLTGDVARILEVSAEAVRFWQRIGRLPALKTERGTRLFNRRDVERFALEREGRHNRSNERQA